MKTHFHTQFTGKQVLVIVLTRNTVYDSAADVSTSKNNIHVWSPNVE